MRRRAAARTASLRSSRGRPSTGVSCARTDAGGSGVSFCAIAAAARVRVQQAASIETRCATLDARDAREPARRHSTASPISGSISTARGCPGSSPSRRTRWFYKRNLSDGPVRPGSRARRARDPSGAHRLATAAGSSSSISPATASSTSSSSTGRRRASSSARPTTDWEPFAPFASLPDIDWTRPEPALRRPDRRRPRRRADHRGRRASPGTRRWRRTASARRSACRRRSTRSEARAGVRRRHAVDLPRRHVRRRADRPVRIRNGEVCYWPNLATAASAPRSTMDDAPLVRPARISSTSAASASPTSTAPAPPTSSTSAATAGDVYFNQSGNGWSAGRRRSTRSRGSTTSSTVAVVDLLGNGTACLVWSSPLPGDARAAAALRRSDGRTEAAPAGRDQEQPRRRDARRVRAVDEVLPGRQARRAGRGSRKLPFPVHVRRAGRP